MNSRNGVARIAVSLIGFLATGWVSQFALAEDLYAPRTDWSEVSSGSINISAFVFRDLDRDGVYDLDDRPMEGVAVRVTGLGGEQIRRSNSNGFANFKMSLEDSEAAIRAPGKYAFEVVVPRDWSATTGHVVQDKIFRIKTGAVAGLVADPPFYPVGLAPDLYVEGALPAGDDRNQVVAGRADGESAPVKADADGRFRLPATPGPWRVTATGEDGDTVGVSVNVDRVPVRLSDSALNGALAPVGAKRVQVDFEAITDKSIREMPSDVAGLNWWNLVALKITRGYMNNAMSGHYVLYNSSGHPARISADQAFDFLGGYFGVAWRKAHGETLQLRGWKDGELRYEDSFALSYLGPVWFEAAYHDIDRLDIASEHYWQVVMDDLTFGTAE